MYDKRVQNAQSSTGYIYRKLVENTVLYLAIKFFILITQRKSLVTMYFALYNQHVSFSKKMLEIH